ncbi:MAG: hypothetical protein HYU64_15925 [Armatimonadetes bacterium]|nr:hypothetical protein [Armatimonadota bacterium]
MQPIDQNVPFSVAAGKDKTAKDAGDPELRALGETLQGYLAYMRGEAGAPEHLSIEESGQRGVETCTCPDCTNRTVNMGFFSIKNTRSGLDMELPYMAVHALANHGQAIYKGTLHEGEVDVERLKQILG